MKKFRFSYKFFFVIIACGVLIGAFGSVGKSSAATELIYNVWVPKMGPVYTTFIKQWVQEVEIESKGRIKITIPPASLGPTDRQYDLVMAGTADFALMGCVYKRNEWSLPTITDIPFTAPSSESATIALWRTYNKFFAPVNEFKGVKVLAFWAFPSIVFEGIKKPIRSISDLKGMKMGVTPGTLKLMMQELGAVPVTAPGIKGFEMISKGTVDGSLSPLFAAQALKYDRYIKHITEVPGGLQRHAFVFFMNQDTWNKLSPEDKKVIENASGEKLGQRIGSVLDKHEQTAVKKQFKENGVTFYTADPAFIEAMKPRLKFVENDWLKAAKKRGIDGKAALDYYKNTASKIDEYSK